MEIRPINASLTVSEFDPTGNPGEYTFTNAVFNNQADESGNGAFDVVVGFVLFVPSTNFNSGTQVPGVVHRYKLTSVSVTDATTISGTMVWDETGEEGLEVPTNGVACGLSATSPVAGFAYAPSPEVYSELAAGSATQSVQADLWNIQDPHDAASGPSSSYKTTVGDATALTFAIHHGLGSLDVSVTMYEISTGADVFAGVTRTGPDDIQIDFTYPIEANSHRVIVRS